MRTIKILLANSRPRIMREVMRQLIGRQPDMEIVAEISDLSTLARVARETGVDVIIIALEDFEALRLASQLLTERPNSIILALAATSDAAYITQAHHGCREIVEPSEANILCALREACKARRCLDASDSMA